jgi:hypothetical protein
MYLLKKYFESSILFLSGFFVNSPDTPSMKRLCGLLCTIFLCATLYHNSFSDEKIMPSTPLVESVALLAFGCLGLTSAENIFKKKK